jgi:hypothetical protein
MHRSVEVAGSRLPVAVEQDRAQGPYRCQSTVASERSSRTCPINNTARTMTNKHYLTGALGVWTFTANPGQQVAHLRGRM